MMYKDKKLITISCPFCGQKYLPAEIYLPDSFLGKPYDIEKTQLGEIDIFDGKSMDTVEEYTCDRCNKRFRVVANVNFKTYDAESRKFNPTYVSQLHTQKISLFEG